MNEQGLARLREELEREDELPAQERARLADFLIGNLQKQREGYVRYLELAGRQRLALIRNNLEENQRTNEESDALCDELTHMEQQRLALTDRILGRVDSPFPTRTPQAPAKCEEIYPLLDVAQADRLREARARLVEVTATLKEHLDVNRSLAENARKIIHSTIVIMTGVVSQPEERRLAVYGKQGKVRAPQSQARSLYNRTV